MKKIRVILLDNNYRFIKSAITFLSNHEFIDVIGGAMSSQIALDMIKKEKPEIAIIERRFINCSDEKIISEINAVSPSTKVIVSSIEDFYEFQTASLEQGAQAFIPKSDFGTEIVSLMNDILIR